MRRGQREGCPVLSEIFLGWIAQRWLTLPTRASSLISLRTSVHIAHKMLRSCPYSASSSVSLLRLLHRRICRDKIVPPRSLSLGIKFVGVLHSSAMAAASEHADSPKNKLALSSSPYLQQHATNPVRILHVNDTQHIHASLVEPALPPRLSDTLHTSLQVDWYPWGEDAFEKARREEKPIFLSVGYSTCHWHVSGPYLHPAFFPVARKPTKAMGRAVLACMQGPARAMPLAAWLLRH